MQTGEQIRILLVDDQPLFRGAIAALIAGQDDMVVVGEAENGLESGRAPSLRPPDRSRLHRQPPCHPAPQSAQR